MFPWNFAKSAELFLSRFAIKRLCKFFLKKKLGKFIHGDIDLDQLDVQLSSGLIQLTDLALNVDYLNYKLEQATIFRIKEGSIRSLLVKLPWNGEGCEVEVNELELVLFPCYNASSNEIAGSHDSNEDDCVNHIMGKGEHDTIYKSTTASMNIHEGVKTVAKMVKSLLTSFSIRIKSVIVAFDACMEEKGEEGSHDALVLRLSELECGVCISEDRVSMEGANNEDFLGISHLMSSLKFEGVTIEILQINSSNPLLTGESGGGFCGSMKFSVPWKNGSLDTCKVDAEVNLDTLIAKLQPSTLKWILVNWELLENYEKNKVENVKNLYEDPDFSASTSHYDPLASPSFDSNVPFREEIVTNVLLKESCFISDWVPFSGGNCKNEAIEEANLEASVDQFFECFDEMRSSQFILGSSGMWNLTCSVFSAISAASNLASGSLNASYTEQEHLETNLKINIHKFSTILSFYDEDQSTQHKPDHVQVDTSFDVHHLFLNLQDILIDAQVYRHEWKSEAIVKHIVLDDYFSQKGDSIDFSLHGKETGVSSQTQTIRTLQEKVLDVLPSSSLGVAPRSLFGSQKSTNGSNLVKATLFETSGTCHCLCTVSSRSFDGNSSKKISFSLKLPPFVLWLNLDLVKVALEFSKNLVSSSRRDKSDGEFSFHAFGKEKKCFHSNISSKSGKGISVGSLFLPCARIFLWFPFKNSSGFRSYLSFDQFIALDLFSPPNFDKSKVEISAPFQEGNSWKKYSPSPSHSWHLHVVNLDVYHITKRVSENSTSSTQKFCSHKILSLGNANRWVVLISMLWHEDAKTGAWAMKCAKNLASFEGLISESSSSRSDYEFVSISNREDKEVSSFKKMEMIVSSKFCLHVCLPVMVITLCRSQYLSFFDLLNRVLDVFGNVGSDSVYEKGGKSVAQSSILLDCGLAEIHIELDPEDSPKGSLERELPGSWQRVKLEIHKFQLLSVFDVGTVSGARFLWISHNEGKLWGSITSVEDQDFLLISCCNSSKGRGDGEGSNVLSSTHAGFDFLLTFDPENFHNLMSITLKCMTIVAHGGRLDWVDKIISFFSLPSREVVDCIDQKGDSERLSFIVKFIDGALSYEPYPSNPGNNGKFILPKSTTSSTLDEIDPCISSLLAASSFTISSTTEDVYDIKLRDVGFLLHKVSEKTKVVGPYSVNYLRENQYIKIASESLLNAILRVNFENDNNLWELNCSESHIILSTCHDTMLGLMRLGSQIQDLFAPDMEESLVHFQNRWKWNSLKQVKGEEESQGGLEIDTNSLRRSFQTNTNVETGFVSLMGEISEDAFLFTGTSTSSFDWSEPSTSDKNSEDRFREGDGFLYPCQNSIHDGNSSIILEEPEIVEGYCLSDLRSLSELTINSHFPESKSLSSFESKGNIDLQRVKSGWYGSTPLNIFENYVPDRTGLLNSKQELESLKSYEEDNGARKFKGRIILKSIDVEWRLYGGTDWHDLRKDVANKGKFCGRDESVCLELALSDMNINYDIFPDGDLCVSKLSLSIHDLYLYDKSNNAPWKQVLGYYYSKEWPRQSFSKAVKLNLEAVRPDPTTPLEEYRLRIAVLPILLHLHQSQLDFLISFFGTKCSIDDPSQYNMKDSGLTDVTLAKDIKAKGLGDEALLPFFQKFDIYPTILRVDYCPSRVDLAALSGGKYVELVNLVPWKGVELHLKHVQSTGVYGWGNVCEIALGEWLEDISQNQIHKLLQGLPAIRSLVAVGSGATKLVSQPVKNYRKDHRLVKGLQRGTVAFLKSISVEALGLGVHLAAGAHEILLHAECILTRIQPSLPRPTKRKLKTKRGGSNQPEDAQHGLRQAYESLSDGMGKTASALVHTPIKTYQRGGGAGSALVTAVRGAPAAAIAPASAAAQALHCALLGVRNSLDPEHKEESLKKYLGPSRSLEKH